MPSRARFVMRDGGMTLTLTRADLRALGYAPDARTVDLFGADYDRTA